MVVDTNFTPNLIEDLAKEMARTCRARMEVIRRALSFFLSLSLSLSVYVCMCVYVFMKNAGVDCRGPTL